MDPPPPQPVTRLPQHRQPPPEGELSDSAGGPSSGHLRDPAGGHLRLVRRRDSRLVRQLDAIETAFSAHHEQLLTSLEALEGDLPAVSDRARGAHEQIAFIRIGLHCLADALGELHTNLVDVAAGETTDDRPRSSTGGAT